MKISKTIILCILLLSFFVACRSSDDKKDDNQFKEQMDSFSQSLKDIDRTMDLVDLLNKKHEELERKVESGELTREEANKIAEQVNKTYQREIARRSNLHPATKLPQWAADLGLTEPNGLIIDSDFSRQTSVNDEGYNSIKLVYIGEYQQAMQQAKTIAEKANIPLSKNYAEAIAMAEKYPSAKKEIRGVAYMNYDASSKNIKYKI